MALWRIFSRTDAISNDGASPLFQPLFGNGTSATESETASKFFATMTASDLRCNVTTMSEPTNTISYSIREGGSTTTVSVAITGTGWVEDLTDSDSIASGAICNYIFVTNGMHGDTCAIPTTMFTIENSSADTPMMFHGVGGVETNTTRWMPMGSGVSREESLDSDVAHNIERATVVNNLSVTTANATSADVDVAPTINGTISANVIVNVTGSGRIEDVVGSESYAVDDTIAWIRDVTSGTVSREVNQVSINTEAVWLTAASGNATTREYGSFTNGGTFTTVDDNHFMRIGSVLAGHLVANIEQAGGSPSDVSARVDSTNSTNLTIDSTSTGYLEDLTGTDAISDGTSLQITLLGTGTQIRTKFASLECPWIDPSVEPPAARNRYHITSS